MEIDTDFLARYGPRALILGGSEGIGSAFAEHLARAGFDLTIIARSQDRLDATAGRLRATYGVDVQTHALDLTIPTVAESAARIVAEHEFGLVICNAGATHGVGLFIDKPLQDATNLIALNCVSTVAFAHSALIPMRERRRGGLIVVASMVGLTGAGYVATYSAAKSFEITLCEGLHWEMARSGVDVMCAIAGLTDTPAMARSGIDLGADPAFQPMDPQIVAGDALRHLGEVPVWYAPGEDAAAAIRAAPRLVTTDQMSRASASLWNIEV